MVIGDGHNVRGSSIMHNDIYKTGGVIVLFNPDWESTAQSISALTSQVDVLCIVDNTPSADHSDRFSTIRNVKYIPLKENKGIAYAQNTAIQYLIDNGCDLIYFSDQDSVVMYDTLANLIQAYTILARHNFRIAAIGSRTINSHTGHPYPSKSKETGPFKDISELKDTVECYSVISSGTLIPVSALIVTGGFDEALFIDGVDHEWCWRAWHAHHLRSFIVNTAYIRHSFGEGEKHIGSKEISIPSYFRVYYQFRNYIWLCRRCYTPKYWKKKNGIKYLVKFFYYPIAIRPRMKFLRYILTGVKDGLSKKYIKSLWPSFQQKNA